MTNLVRVTMEAVITTWLMTFMMYFWIPHYSENTPVFIASVIFAYVLNFSLFFRIKWDKN